MRSVGLPNKAYAPLIVDADGMLPFSVSLEGFEPVARRYAELQQLGDGMKLGQLPQGGALDVRWEGTNFLPLKQSGGVVAGEGVNHAS